MTSPSIPRLRGSEGNLAISGTRFSGEGQSQGSSFPLGRYCTTATAINTATTDSATMIISVIR